MCNINKFYTDILAYTLIDSKININQSKIKLYRYITGSRLQAADNEQQDTERVQEENAIIPEQVNETQIENNSSAGENITVNETAKQNNESDKTVEENSTANVSNEQNPIAVNESSSNGNANGQDSSNRNNGQGNANGQDKEKTNKGKSKGITGKAIDELNASNEGLGNTKLTSIIKEEVNFTAYDLNEDGLVDYIEWNVPHLSNQTYELIIEISDAEHLDENRELINNIYDEVYKLDNNWSEPIYNDEYVRVTFKQPLDRTRDITVFAKRAENSSVIVNGTEVPSDIYEKKKRIDELRRILNETE